MIKLHSLRVAKFKQLDDLAIVFPEQGSILVQGLNEAGKSTLFESIYFALFGKGLATEDNAGKLDDLINYQSPRALVQLTLGTDNADFTISRNLNRGRANTAVLDLTYGNGKREQVTSLTTVNRRIVEELGLDGEALLNSCFVEQKKLEKLEAMTAQQRRDTLLRLLNLDRLGALETRYKTSAADEVELQQRRDRLALADIQSEQPQANRRFAQVEQELGLLYARKLLNEQAELKRAVDDDLRQQATLQEEAERLAQQIERIQRLGQVRDLAKAAGEALSSAQQEEQEIDRLSSEMDELRRRAAEVPALRANAAELEKIAGLLAEVAHLREEASQLERRIERLMEASARLAKGRRTLNDREAQLDALEEELRQAQVDVAGAERDERRRREAEALQDWLNVWELATAAEGSLRELHRLQGEMAALEETMLQSKAALGASQRTGFGLAAAAFLCLLISAAAVVWAGPAGVIGIIFAAVLAVFSRRAFANSKTARSQLEQAQGSLTESQALLHRKQGECDLARRSGLEPRRLAEVEEELRALDVGVPRDLEEGRRQLNQLTVAGDGQPGAADGNSARRRVGELEGQRQALQAEITRLQRELLAEGDPVAAAEAERQKLDELEAFIAARLGAAGDGYTDVADAREELAAVRAAERAAEEAVRKSEELAANVAARQQRMATRRDEVQSGLAELRALLQEPSPAVVGEGRVRAAYETSDETSAPQLLENLRTLWRETKERIAILDEPRLKQQATETTQRLAASQERSQAGRRQMSRIDAELQALGVDLGAAQAADLEREGELRREHQDLLGRMAALQDRRRTLERQLKLEGLDIDYDEALEAARTFEEQLKVKAQAYRIVGLARRSIVAKVLPSTVRNMRLLLPLLTNERYRDVEITDEYKIRVWDDTAQALKAKDIFSGGTRDQFSLAMRLAFALATLPEELGTAPGFIFLDEPLSSFDPTRTEALVALLTRGLIAANFKQIFVISHSQSFDESLFDYHLYLEGGRIAATDLPEAPVTEGGPPPALIAGAVGTGAAR